jgi:hypothetical protein
VAMLRDEVQRERERERERERDKESCPGLLRAPRLPPTDSVGGSLRCVTSRISIALLRLMNLAQEVKWQEQNCDLRELLLIGEGL